MTNTHLVQHNAQDVQSHWNSVSCSGSKRNASVWEVFFDLAHLGGHGPGLSPHPLLVVCPILAEAGVGLGLGGVLDVGVVEQVLDPQQDLLDGDGGPPVLLLVQDGQAN